jgi:cyanophycinase-like exopeptidase
MKNLLIKKGMKNILGILLLLSNTFLAQNYTSYFTGNTTDLVVNPKGGTCLMGGAGEHDNAMRWFLEQANGGDILVLRASGSDGYNTYLFSDLGVTVNSVETIVFNNAQASNDTYVLDKIQKAEAIWFAGGNQWNYISYWRNSAVSTLINSGISNRKIVVGGISAGMAILGGNYFTAENGTISSQAALMNPLSPLVTVSNQAFLEVPFLNNVVTDTHYDNPNRKGRHVVFMANALSNSNEIHGIACDEYVAVCIDTLGIAHVYGEYPQYDEKAYFLSVNCEVDTNFPETLSANQPLTWNQNSRAIKVYKAYGTLDGTGNFNLNNWQEGTGGGWENWSVENGLLQETTSVSAPDCNLNVSEESFKFQIKNPIQRHELIQIPQNVNSIQIVNELGVNCEFKIAETNTISLTHPHSGIYFLRFEIEGRNHICKLIVL